MTTDTPRTDSARTLGGVIVNDSWALLGEPRSFDSIDVVPADFARQLERELKASKADADFQFNRLTHARDDAFNLANALSRAQADVEALLVRAENAEADLIRTQIEMQLEIDRADANSQYWRERAEKAESEVERLKKELADWDYGTRAKREQERAEKAEAEVEGLTGRMKEAEDLIKGLHGGWKKARVAHLETCKNAQAEIDKLHTENICLQELIQEFYEWTKREYPPEQEVREIMNRYHNLLNK